MGSTARSGGAADLGATSGKKVQMRGPGASKTVLTVRKLQEAPQRLLKEKDIIEIADSLCEKCRTHCDGFVHLTSGRGGQHLNSDIEISELIRQINKNDLLQLLTVEKGSVAKIMIDIIDLAEP